MPADSLEQVIDRVKKLYNLADNTNEHEAARAIAAAERLMQKYRLTQVDLIQTHAVATEVPSEYEHPIELSGRIHRWKSLLFNDLARQYGCSLYYLTHRPKVGPKRIEVKVVGLPSDVAMLKIQYESIKQQINSLTRTNTNGMGIRHADSYRKGIVDSVRRVLRELTNQLKQESSTTAIVLLDSRLPKAKKARDELHPNLTDRPTTFSEPESNAYIQGWTDGDKVHLGRELPDQPDPGKPIGFLNADNGE
jgi:hypothetical protein